MREFDDMNVYRNVIYSRKFMKHNGKDYAKVGFMATNKIYPFDPEQNPMLYGKGMYVELDIPTGEYRELSSEEFKTLQNLLESSKKTI